MINKGFVSSVDEGSKTAIVIPQEASGIVTFPLVIPFYLRECLKVNMSVAYAVFPDNTGVILARMDGEWNHKIYEWLDIEGTAHVTEGVSADEQMIVKGSMVVKGTVSSESSVTAPSVTAGEISLSGHTHSGVETGSGSTGGPQ